jgi:hypothetical protein
MKMHFSVANNSESVVRAINEHLLPRGLSEPVRLVSYEWPYITVAAAGEIAEIKLTAVSSYMETRNPAYLGRGRDLVSWEFDLDASDWRPYRAASIA